MCDEWSRSLPRQRADKLARRVRWLDRYRRYLALLAAAIIAPFLIIQVGEVLGGEWPEMHVTLLSLMLGVIVWWIIEVGLIYLTASWEAEHDRLVRDHGLPRAIVRKARG
jgi:polyferredoxin